MKFNINHKVRVKLTPLGREIMVKNHNDLFGANADKFPMLQIEETDGWSVWQLWVLMAEFGPHLRGGFSIPFETEIEILEPAEA